MNLYPDYSQIIYRYINNKLIGKVYQGEELTYKFIETYKQNLPIKFKSLFSNYLLNYKIYGTSEGAGVETENLFDKNTALIGYEILGDTVAPNSLWFVTDYMKVDPQTSYIAPASSWGSACLEYASKEGEPTRTSFNNITGVTTLSTTQYIRLNGIINTIDNKMLIEGSTAPSTYIPHGYKLPLTVESGETENLFDITTQIVGEGLVYDGNTATSTITNRSDYISVNSSTAYTLWHNTTDSTKRMIQFFDSSKIFVSNTDPALDTNPITFTTPENCAYIRIAYPNTSKEVMLVQGSTPPDHYIPHRYTSDIPIYIGSTKLGEEEYVDYESDKIYKTINIFNKDTAERYELAKATSSDNVVYYSRGAMFFVEAVQNTDYTLKVESNTVPSTLRLYRSGNPLQHLTAESTIGISYTEVKDVISGENTVSINSVNSRYIWLQFGAIWWEQESSTATILLHTLQPTDPPVPLPPIQTYKGENTLSTNISLGEVTIKGRIESITPPESIIYGYHINPNESDPSACITYIEDAIGKNPASMGTTTFDYGDWENAFFMPKPCMIKYDGTVDYYLNPNDYTKKEDGSDSDISNINYQGNAMMQWPKIYWKYESGQTEGEGYFYVSNTQVDNSYKCWCNIDSKNNEIDYFYTAIYNGTSAPTYDNAATYNIGDYVTYTDTTYTNGALYQCNTAITTAEEFDSTKWTLINASSPLRSLSGIQTNQANGCGYLSGTIQENRALANNTTVDTEWYFDVLSDRMLINGLLILMGKSLNTQTVFGNGITSGSEAGKNAYVTGSLNDKGLFYGDVSGTTTAIKVFGMENWWGHTWHRTAGLIGGANNTYLYKLTYNNYDGSTSTSYNSTGTGYLTAISNNTATNIIRPSNNVDGTNVYWYNKASYGKWGYLPIQVGGSSTTYYADYFYNGTGYLLVGGGSGSGARAGASCFTLNPSFADAHWAIGAALSLKPLALGART